jgi:hypothetical protein
MACQETGWAGACLWRRLVTAYTCTSQHIATSKESLACCQARCTRSWEDSSCTTRGVPSPTVKTTQRHGIQPGSTPASSFKASSSSPPLPSLQSVCRLHTTSAAQHDTPQHPLRPVSPSPVCGTVLHWQQSVRRRHHPAAAAPLNPQPSAYCSISAAPCAWHVPQAAFTPHLLAALSPTGSSLSTVGITLLL